MKGEYPLVVTHQYVLEAKKWLKALSRGENVSVIFFPKTDRFRRLQQFLEDRTFLRKSLGNNARYMFQLVDFSAHNIEDAYELREHIAQQLNLAKVTDQALSFVQWLTYFKEQGIRLVLVLAEADKYLSSGEKNILSLLSLLVTEYAPFILTLNFYEIDITHPTFVSVLPSSVILYENIYYYPLYSQKDTTDFVQYLEKKWNAVITPEIEREIVKQCGGHFWLIKEAVRQLGTSVSHSFYKESMRFRLQTIYNLLLPSEQSVLKKIITRKKLLSPEEQHSLQHLQKMSLIDGQNRCLIGLYKNYLLAGEHEIGEFALKDNRIMLNQVPLDKFFSRKEYRVLKLLIEHKANLVTRGEIAKSIWPTNTTELYSDWAIDQIIARLRKRLVELAVSPSLIQVVRGKGYQFRGL